MASPPRSDPYQRQERQPLDQLALLYTMADHIQRARHVDLIYQDAVDGLRRALAADRSALLVVDADGRMRSRAWSGFSETSRTRLEEDSPWPRFERDPRPVVIADLESAVEPRIDRDALLADGVRSLALVPLLHRGRLTGQIALGRDEPRAFDEAEIRLAEAISSHLAFAIWRNRSDVEQEELLRRFEAERSVLESVVKQMPAGVLLADVPSGRIVLSNPQVSTTWGRTLRHASQVSDYALWGGRTPNGDPIAPEEWPLARSVLHGETVRGEEILIDREDGTRGVIRMSSAPVVDSRGRQLAAVATVQDVTREREEEARQAFLEEGSQILNASLELPRTLEALARVLVGPYANWCAIYRCVDERRIDRAAVAHVDVSRSESVVASTPAELELDSDHPVAGVIRSGAPLVSTERDAHSSEGDARDGFAAPSSGRAPEPQSTMILPLVARERVLGALYVARTSGRYGDDDVALMGELARRASIAIDNALLYEQARAADRAKANFLAVMSHEFRTPLSAILGYADILTAEVHGSLNPHQRKHLERVKASVRHLSHLVDEILSFASMEAGRERVRPERLELVSVVTDAVAIMDPIAEAAGLDVRVAVPDVPVEMSADGPKLRQILINLLSNAIKYTPDGHVELALDVTRDAVRIAVSDTGRGIAPEHFENVFEPYWQVEHDSRRIAGTGLGLAVARRLARLMGGDIRLSSEVGVGSTFTLELPRTAPGLARADPS